MDGLNYLNIHMVNIVHISRCGTAESVMCDVIKISLLSIFLGVPFPTSPFILSFYTYFYDVTHDSFRGSFSAGEFLKLMSVKLSL